MALFAVPLVLILVTLVAALVRATAHVAEEADQLRVALVRVGALRPVAAEIGDSARRLSTGIARLGS